MSAGHDQSTAEASNRQAEVARADEGFALMRAQFQVAGYALGIITGADGSPTFLVSRWAMHRELPNREALDKFARSAGVAS